MTSELRCRWSKIREWTEGLTVTFIEEAQQYGGVNEVVVVSRLMAQSLVVFGGDKCQTPGGLNKEAESSSMARQKLISRQHGLRLESEQLQPVHLLHKFRSFVLHSNSPLTKELIDLAGTSDDHERVFKSSCDQFLESVCSLFPHLAMLKQQTGRLFFHCGLCQVQLGGGWSYWPSQMAPYAANERQGGACHVYCSCGHKVS